MARKILAVGPRAVAFSLDAVDRGLQVGLEQSLKIEAQAFADCFSTEDMREGTKAFIEKRPPKFTGM